MNKKTALVMKGFIELSEVEKTDLINEITKYQRGNFSVRKDLNESVNNSVNFGPAPGGGCPCCGK